MIDTLIFDFGDVFINLDKKATQDQLQQLGLKEWGTELQELNFNFEKGHCTRETFIEGLRKQIPNASTEEILKAWNAILLDFPLYRLEFLQQLSKNYRLFLLSNTDAIHIDTFEQRVGSSFYSAFYQCFEKVYYSFEMGMRKPELDIYQHVLHQHELSPKRTLFIDDKKENTDAAQSLGIHIWNLKVGSEDVVDLLDKEFF